MKKMGVFHDPPWHMGIILGDLGDAVGDFAACGGEMVQKVDVAIMAFKTDVKIETNAKAVRIACKGDHEILG